MGPDGYRLPHHHRRGEVPHPWGSDCTLLRPVRGPLSRGCLQEHDDTGKVFDALADPNKITVVQMAPAVRVAGQSTTI